jgi:hypothetical protein
MMPISPNEKFAEELQKMVRYWEIEFDLDKWSITGVLLDVAVDVLFDNHQLPDDSDEDEDDDE